MVEQGAPRSNSGTRIAGLGAAGTGETDEQATSNIRARATGSESIKVFEYILFAHHLLLPAEEDR